jgi:hypothetical protein
MTCGFSGASIGAAPDDLRRDYEHGHVKTIRWRNAVTLLWFIVWFISNLIGDNEALIADPVNGWLGTLILAVALDLSRQHAPGLR